MSPKRPPLSKDAQEWLDCIIECDGAEVQQAAWPTVQELVRAGIVTLGPARGPEKLWRRAILVVQP